MRTTSLVAVLGLATSLAAVPVLASTAAAAEATCDGRAATIVAAPATTWPPQWTLGTPGDDVIVGTDRADRIDGGGGDDVVCGLDGADHLVGGPGDDRLFGGLDDYSPDDDYWGDVVEPGPGDDHVDLGADLGPDDITSVDSVHADQVSYAGAAGPVSVDLTALTASGEGTDTFAATPPDTFAGIVGSPFDDTLTGGPGADQVHGGGGDDTIAGRDGDDLLHGDLSWSPDDRRTDRHVPGDDLVQGGAGADLVEGGHGLDVLSGDDGDDVVAAAEDAHGTTLDGGTGDDHLVTAEGTRARGGSGDDTLRLGLGRGKRAADTRVVVGGGGQDRVELQSYTAGRVTYELSITVPERRITLAGGRFATVSGAEEFVVDGNRGRGLVTFRGGPRPELFRIRWASGFPVRASGGGGADTLVGGNRGDLLDGGPGRDLLRGGDGQDRCVRGERLSSCERRR